MDLILSSDITQQSTNAQAASQNASISSGQLVADKGFDTVLISLICFPCLLVISSVGNALNIIVLSRLPIQVKEILLIGLAISDLLIVWVGLPVYIDHHAEYLGVSHYNSPFFVQSLGCFRWLKQTFYYVSDGIFILFSCERLMAFWSAHFHRHFKNQRHLAFISITILIICSGIISLEPLVSYYHWRAHETTVHGNALKYEIPEWLDNWTNFQGKIDIILPIIILIVIVGVNIWLLLYLRASLVISAKLRVHRSGDEPHNRDSALVSGLNMQGPLLGCCMLYFITQFPAVVLNTVSYATHSPHASPWLCRAVPLIEQLKPIVWILSLVNYTANFLVYAGFSRKYRLLMEDTLCERRTNHWKSRPSRCSQSEQELNLLGVLAPSRIRSSFAQLINSQHPALIAVTSNSTVQTNLSFV